MADQPKLTLDNFIAKVVNDPAKPQEPLLLQGFLGASSQSDHTRVYSDLTLTSYVDVANADIIHTEPMPKEQSPMGGSYLWVNKDAEVYSSTPAGPGTAKAKFLQGPIATAGFGITANFNCERTQVCPALLDTLACPHQVGVAGLRQAAIAQPELQVPITSPARGCHATFPEPMCRPTYTPMDCPPTYLVGCVQGAAPLAAAAPAASLANACGTSNFACFYHPTLNPACFVATGPACYLPPWTVPETINQTPVGQVQQFAAAVQPQAAVAQQAALQPQLLKPPPTLTCTYGPPQCPPTYYHCSTQYPRCGY